MRTTFLVILLAVLITACGSASQEVKLTSYELPASVDVTFNALAPENSPAGEPVLFTILDAVSGLEYNPQLISMQASGDRSFAVTISVPTGTLVKYRYTRQAAAENIDEISAAGQPIAYREYLVDGPGHVANDLIAAWADAPSNQPGGQVSGLVTAAGSGQPLAGLAVSASGIQTNTDTDGHFVIGGLPQGLHNIVVSAPDGSYFPFQQGALVAAGSDTQANIQVSSTTTASITFHLQPAKDSASAVPTYLVGDLAQFDSKPQLNLQSDGSYLLTLQLPTGLDIRYKYTLGDGFWNAEHAADGGFVVRQLVIPAGTTELTIEDQVADWTSGASAAIWFDLTAPAPTENVYLQFKLLNWAAPLRMWALGNGHFAYVLYSPTNFATALEYQYCLDSTCTIPEAAPGQPRSVAGNQPAIQQIRDSVEAWQGQ